MSISVGAPMTIDEARKAGKLVDTFGRVAKDLRISLTDEARYSPGERYGAVYQINYLRCIFCGMCIEACPTRSLTMTNDYELADDNRQDLIFTKEDLIAPLLPGMEQPPHPMRLGDDENDYYLYGPELAAAAATASNPAPASDEANK